LGVSSFEYQICALWAPAIAINHAATRCGDAVFRIDLPTGDRS
jgi:hypothetical protein